MNLTNSSTNKLATPKALGDFTFSTPFKAISNYGLNAGGWSSFGKFPRQVADVNGDGRADIIGFGDGATFVSLGKSNGTFGSPFQAISNYGVTAGGWSSFDKFPRQVADVNGDGRADVIGFGDGATFVSLGQSSGTFGSPFQAISNYGVTAGGWSSFGKFPRQVADVNGDGRADVIGFGDGATFVSLGQSSGTFGSPFQAISNYGVTAGGWSSFNTYPRQVADVNGDGRADIIGFASDGVYVSLSQYSPPTISINNLTVTEGNSGNKLTNFTVNLSKPSSKIVTVNYLTSNGTAISNRLLRKPISILQ